MANTVSEVLLTNTELNLWQEGPDGSGAIVDFWGRVRPLEHGAEIEGIEYEVHKVMAEHQLRVIAQQATEKFGLHAVIIHHRLGFVPVNEASVFVRTASQNRAQAFEANQWIMNQLKTKVPIWKQPRFHRRSDKDAAVSTSAAIIR